MHKLSKFTGEDGKLKIKVPYEDITIEIALDFEDRKDVVLYGFIRELQRKVEALEGKVLSDKQLITNLSDEQAEEIIKEQLLKLKSIGKIRISMVDLIRTIPIPSEQIERIMEKLEKENKISEY